MTLTRSLIVYGVTLCSFAMVPSAPAALPAFPGAVGQGSAASGGRGGDVYHVTNLLDYNSDEDEQKIEGSLRHAIRSAEGPRTIVFDVSGAIPLACPLKIMKNQLTIAGQTSPAGITLWGYPFEVSQCSDVVVRYLRMRLGDFHASDNTGANNAANFDGNADLDADSANAVSIHGEAERVILDHMSACWGMDETLSVTQCRDVTVQHTLIAESLRRSFHAKGAHGYGSLVRGELTTQDQAANVGGFTFYQNLWAHHDARNPSIAGQQRLAAGESEDQRRRTDVNLVNCVIYNWGNEPTHRSNDGQVRLNLLDNCYVVGPAKQGKYIFRGTDRGTTAVRHRGNLFDRSVDGQLNGTTIDSTEEVETAFHDMNEDDAVELADPPFEFLGNLESSRIRAEQAFQRVVAEVGASLWRDAADQRVISSLMSGNGKLIDSQEELRTDGRLPELEQLPSTRRPDDYDTDRDGMSDAFELANGLDPGDASDRNETTLSPEGYTNLEVFLHSLTSTDEGR